MDTTQNLLILLALVSNVVFCNKQLLPETVCYPYVGCFDPVNFFDLGIFVPDSPESVGTQFQYYNSSTPDNSPIILDYTNNSTLKAFDGSKSKTIFIVHGWMANSSDPILVAMRKAFFNKFQDLVNIIMVDYQKGASYLLQPLRVAVNGQLVGRQIAYLAQLLIELRNLDSKSVHLIGHSLGAQVCGFAGKWFQAIANNKVGRLTSLDAGGAWFQLQNTSYHVAKTDAEYVDAIHTFAGQVPIFGGVGYLPPIGEVDFYPNGGRIQPNCINNIRIFNISSVLADPQNLELWCSHDDAVSYFTESIADNCPFTSNPCPDISSDLFTPIALPYGLLFCNQPCTKNCGRMGYYSNVAQGREEQFLTTNDNSPFCKG